MTKWKRWRAETSGHYKDDLEQFHAMSAWLRTHEEAQPPRHPIHMMLFMRWIYGGTARTSLRDDRTRQRGIYAPPP